MQKNAIFALMNFQPKVSVIIPVYNVERYLRECVDSVLGQSYENIELILVDDGSTDGSGTICDEYAGRDSRVRVFHQSNGGQSVARNAALDVARGDWVMFVDSDDAITGNAIEMLLTAAVNSKSDISMGSFISAESPIGFNSESASRFIKMSGAEACERVLYQTDENRGLIVSAWGKLFAKEAIDRFRFTPGILYEDLELVPRILASINQTVCLSSVIYFYRTNSESSLGRFNSRRFDVLDVCDRLMGHFASDARLRRAAADRRMSAAFNMLMLMARNRLVDDAIAERCRDIVRGQRFDSLVNPRVRFRNKAGIILSYLFGIGFFSRRCVAELFLKR